jgi:putative phage-type endonuclease
MRILAKTKNITEKEWLEWRKKGIGGSDVSAIAGINPWKTEIEVYLEKTGACVEPTEKSKEANERMEWGKKLEDLVAKEFEIRTGKKVRRKNAILQHDEYPFMLANIDRDIVGENAILECKTTSAYNSKAWEDEGVPDHYMLQVQHYLAVTRADVCYVAVLIGGQKFKSYTVKIDQEMVDYIIKIEQNFWQNNVVAGVMPDIMNSKITPDLLSLLYPETKNSTITLDDEHATLAEQSKEFTAKEKEYKEKKEEVQLKLKALLGENEFGICRDFYIKNSEYLRKSFDKKLFQEEHPDIFPKYETESKYRRFSISKIKEGINAK